MKKTIDRFYKDWLKKQSYRELDEELLRLSESEEIIMCQRKLVREEMSNRTLEVKLHELNKSYEEEREECKRLTHEELSVKERTILVQIMRLEQALRIIKEEEERRDERKCKMYLKNLWEE